MNNTLKTQLKGWYPVLQETLESKYFKEIKAAIKEDMKTEEIYPKGTDILKAFSLCPIEETKIVIIGQEPYHDGTATGLAFANPTKCEIISPSLDVIKEELETTVGLMALPFNQNLEHWSQQGVLLLNTALTTKRGAPGAHIDLWDRFTTTFLQNFSRLKTKVIYMLWGEYAQQYEQYISKGNHILKASHPISEIYKNQEGGFLGCDHFNLANDIILDEYGEEEQIQWLYTPSQIEFLNNANIKDNFDEI